MGKFQDAVNVVSNFITPPDFVKDIKQTILLIDVAEHTVHQLAHFCKTSPIGFNVYLYNHTMNDVNWLLEASQRADQIIIDTDESSLSHIKERLCEMDKAMYFGPKSPLISKRRIQGVIEYFIDFTKDLK